MLVAEQSKSLASAKKERTELIAAFAAKNRGMSACCHMTFFGRELEHFHFARQAGGTGFARLTTALQGPPSLSLHRPPPCTSLCQRLWISSLESL